MLLKRKFKLLTKNACEIACFKNLLIEKSKLSKGSEITYSSFEMQGYLKPGNGLSIEEKQKIYHIRCRQIYLKCNFPSSFNEKKCLAPHKANDDQRHVFYCSFFISPNEVVSSIVKYEDIFSSNINKQVDVLRIFLLRLEKRTLYLPLAKNGDPVDPSRGLDSRPSPRLGIREAAKKN